MRFLCCNRLNDLLASGFCLDVSLKPIRSLAWWLSTIDFQQNERVNITSDLTCCSVEGVLSPPDDVYLGAINCEALSDGLAKTGASAGNDDNLSLDGEKVLNLEGDMLLGHI